MEVCNVLARAFTMLRVICRSRPTCRSKQYFGQRDRGLTGAVADPTLSTPWKQGATERVDGAEAVARQVIVKFRSLPDLSKAYAADARRRSILEVVKNQDIQRHRPVGSTGAELFESRSRDIAVLRAEIASRTDVLHSRTEYQDIVRHKRAGFGSAVGPV